MNLGFRARKAFLFISCEHEHGRWRYVSEALCSWFSSFIVFCKQWLLYISGSTANCCYASEALQLSPRMIALPVYKGRWLLLCLQRSSSCFVSKFYIRTHLYYLLFAAHLSRGRFPLQLFVCISGLGQSQFRAVASNAGQAGLHTHSSF